MTKIVTTPMPYVDYSSLASVKSLPLEPPKQQQQQQQTADCSKGEITTQQQQQQQHYSTGEQQQQGNNNRGVARGGVVTPFQYKLHDMLEEHKHDNIISWCLHGRAFQVHKPLDFVQHVMPMYFSMTKFASFQRQLNLYSFRRLTTGRDKGAYYHQYFLRGERPLCQHMVRQKVKGTKVRRAVAPGLEPNFWNMAFLPPTTTTTTTTSQSQQSNNNNNTNITTTTAQTPPPTTTTTNEMTTNPLTTPSSSNIVTTAAPPVLRIQAPPKPITPTSSEPSSPSTPTPTTSTTTSGPPTPTLSSEVVTVEKDQLLFFEGKPFHYLDKLLLPSSLNHDDSWGQQGMNVILQQQQQQNVGV